MVRFLDSSPRPCVVYMLRDADILQDVADITKVGQSLWPLACHLVEFLCIPVYISHGVL